MKHDCRARMARDRSKLKVFHLAHRFAVTVFKKTRSIPASDRDVRSQLRRAATSVPSNISEGCARRSRKEYLRFLDIALGSASEADYLLDFCHEVELLDSTTYAECKHCGQETIWALQKLIESVERLSP